MKHSFEAALASVDGTLRPGGRYFPGWTIVGSAAMVQFLAGVLFMNCYGAYTVLLEQEFEWSKAALSGAFALTRVESGILGPLQGWLTDRYGPRIILTIGTVIFGLGFMLFASIDSLLTFYLCFAMIALGSSLGGFATLMVAIVNWFDAHRAKAVAVSQMGFSLGGVCVPLVILSLQTFGWRATAFGSGVIILLVGLPLVQLVRHKPSEIGLLPDGARSSVTLQHAESVGSGDFTTRQALRTRAFWLLSVGHSLALLTVSAVMVHLVPHLIDAGYTLAQAGIAVGVLTTVQIGGQLLGGGVGDRFDKRFICVLCMVGHAVGLTALAYAPGLANTLLWLAIFMICHGIAWGVRGPLMVALRADYFGASSFGTIMGFSSLIVMIGMSTGPLVAGYAYDVTGSYSDGFIVIAGCAIIGCLCFAFARPPGRAELSGDA